MTYEKLLADVRHIAAARRNIILLFENLYVESHYLHKAISNNVYHQNSIYNKYSMTMMEAEMEQGWSSYYRGRIKSIKNRNKKILDAIKLNCTKYHHEIDSSSVRELKSNQEEGIFGFS